MATTFRSSFARRATKRKPSPALPSAPEQTKLANTLQEAAARTGFSVPYLRVQIKEKNLRAMRYGRAIRILERDLIEFLEKGVY